MKDDDGMKPEVFVCRIGDYIFAWACSEIKVEGSIVRAMNGDRMVGQCPANSEWALLPKGAYNSARKATEEEPALFKRVFG